MNHKLEVLVTYKKGLEKNTVDVLPNKLISIRDQAHILASGISLLIKSCSKFDSGIKDYELIKEIIEHINHEFTSTDSFYDVTSLENK